LPRPAQAGGYHPGCTGQPVPEPEGARNSQLSACLPVIPARARIIT